MNKGLVDRAALEMAAAGLRTTFDTMCREQVERCRLQMKDGAAALAGPNTRDLRNLLWSSIDNQESRDLDQLEYAETLEDGKARILVAIADVDFFVARDTPLDLAARANTTSVYTGVINYPMLPEEISCDLTSLLPSKDRLAIVYDLLVGREGHVLESHVYRALVASRAKLDYKSVGSWLEGGAVPDGVSAVPGLAEQVKLQQSIKDRILGLRKQRGSLFLSSVEAHPVVRDGTVLDLELDEDNAAKELVENLMIAANVAVSEYLDRKGFPSIKRIVQSPERWDKVVELVAALGGSLPPEPDARALQTFLLESRKRDPLRFPDVSLKVVKLLGRGSYQLDPPGVNTPGHFALAVNDYTHSTAPNRRYVDLITQRLLKAAMDGTPLPYSEEELSELAEKCNRQSSAAKKVERRMRKVAAASLFERHIGRVYEAIVTGIKGGAVYVRTLKPPVEGRVTSGEKGQGKVPSDLDIAALAVGDEVTVKLVAVDESRAFIDFALVPTP